MSLEVYPLDSLYNRTVTISAHGLIPNTIYEVKLLYSHNVGTFRSFGVFKSNGCGGIDLNLEAPLRGTYSGVRPMGLFESLMPLSDFREGGYLRFSGEELKALNYEVMYVRTTTDSNVYSLSDATGAVVDSKKLLKRLQGENVERREIEDESGLRGVLFKPKGNGTFPAIIDVLGTGGGLSEHRAAALASEGFCVLVIAYFQYKDLTKNMHNVELDYFINAVNWMSSRTFTTDKVGLHGSSFGGIMVLLLAKHCSQVAAVVSINPPHVMNNFAHIKNKGVPFPHAIVDSENLQFRGNILIYDKAVQTLEVTEEVDHHFDKIPAQVDVRFVVSMDDLSTSSIYSTRYITDKLHSTRHYVQYECVVGGHIMEPPYFPFHEYCFSRLAGGFMAYGGEPSLHAISECKVWSNTVNFFKNRLVIASKL